MTGPNRDLAAAIGRARSALAEYGTGAGTKAQWADKFAAVLRVMLADFDPVPAEVEAAARRAPSLSQALYEIGTFSPAIAVFTSRWLRGEITASAGLAVRQLHLLPPRLNAARDVVVDAVRAREARHAALVQADELIVDVHEDGDR